MSRRPRCFSGPFRIAAAALLTVVYLGACSDDSGDDGATRSDPTTTLTAAQDDELALRQLAEDWYDTINLILKDGADPTTAEDYITGRYYEQFVDDVQERRSSGRTSERSPRSRLEIESIELTGNSAQVTTCEVDADILRGPEGEVLNDEVGTLRFATTAAKDGSEWRFTERERLEQLEGDQCAD